MYMTITKTKLQLIAEQFLQEEQYSFLKGRLCTNAIFVIKQILERGGNIRVNCFHLFYS
jgi:hypothetical protein